MWYREQDVLTLSTQGSDKYFGGKKPTLDLMIMLLDNCLQKYLSLLSIQTKRERKLKRSRGKRPTLGARRIPRAGSSAYVFFSTPRTPWLHAFTLHAALDA